MKFSTKIPKFNKQAHTALVNEGWKPLKEPQSLISAMLLAVPFMIINVCIPIAIIYYFSKVSLQQFSFIKGDTFTLTIDLGVIITILLVIIIHEFFHLIFIPNFWKERNTVVGLNFLVAFVHTEQTLTKARFLVILMTPFLCLSVLFPIILGILGIFTGKMLIFILFNALGASVDILSFFLIFVQVPKKAVIRNNGTRSYWKMTSE